jgi:hypothetical protein
LCNKSWIPAPSFAWFWVYEFLSKPVDVSFQYIDLDLGFFYDKFGSGRGINCFYNAPVQGKLTAMGVSKEKDKTAYAAYWFSGFGADSTTEVSYMLEMSGAFVGKWRPDSTTTARDVAIPAVHGSR